MDFLDSTSTVSLYLQLKEIFINKIRNKEWKLEDRIPAELDLCKHYLVSRITVRQALSELVNEGYLIRKQGKGTFVSIPKIEQSLTSFYSLSEEFEKMGFVPHSDLLEFSLQIPGPEICKELNLSEENNKAYYFKRLRYADDVLIAIESTYIPADLFFGLKEEEIKQKHLYDVMRDTYGIIPTSAEESIGATLIGEKESIYFRLKKGCPAISLERLTYSNNRCIEYTYGVIRGDKYKFRVNLKR